MMKSRRPAMTAFVIWFVHFVLCWAAVEIWPSQPRANHLAWVFTALALVAMAVHHVRLGRRHERSELTEFNRRFARGAVAIATLAVLFTALPSLVIRS
jgi:hypothetical protein